MMPNRNPMGKESPLFLMVIQDQWIIVLNGNTRSMDLRFTDQSLYEIGNYFHSDQHVKGFLYLKI